MCVCLAALLCCFTAPDDAGKCHFVGPQPGTDTRERDSRLETGSSGDTEASQSVEQPVCEDGSISRSSALSRDPAKAVQSPSTDNLMSRRGPKEGELSKVTVRQRLAFISSFYPVACPCRGNLKEVYSFARRHMLSRRT